jgi:acyl-coenzyme A thioesterase PaaI-like protein
MNWYPMYFGTGGKILFWAEDHSELHIRLRLNPWTYNYVGTIFGGSMFAASDPFYMLMLLRSLGTSYVVWDKSATIRFRKPGKSTLYAVCKVSEEDRQKIKEEVELKGETTRDYTITWMDKKGVAYAEIVRHCYIASKEHYQKKKGQSQAARFRMKGADEAARKDENI